MRIIYIFLFLFKFYLNLYLYIYKLYFVNSLKNNFYSKNFYQNIKKKNNYEDMERNLYIQIQKAIIAFISQQKTEISL